MAFPDVAYFNPDEPMPHQTLDWSCSACSLAWLNRAMLIDRGTTEATAIELIGVPEHINSTYGLMDGSGARLASLLRADRGAAGTLWPTFDEAIALSASCAILLGGSRWYHWVGVRSASDDVLWIANSAQGWQGVTTFLTRDHWLSLGPWACVAVPIRWSFPDANSTIADS